MVRIGTNYDRPTFRPVLSPHGGENPKKQPKMARFGPFWPVFSVQSLRNLLQLSHSGPGCSKWSETFATGSVPTASNFLPFTALDGIASSGPHAHFSAQKCGFRPPGDQQPTGAPGSPKSDFSAGLYLRNPALRAEPTCSKPNLNHGFGGKSGM